MLISIAYDPVVRAYPEIRFFLIKLRVVLLVVLFGALHLLTGRFGLVGAITAVVLVAAMENSITALKTANIIGVKFRDIVLLKDVAKILFAAMGAALVTWTVRGLISTSRPLVTLIVCGAVFAIVYGALVLVLGVLTREERQALRNRTRKLSFAR